MNRLVSVLVIAAHLFRLVPLWHVALVMLRLVLEAPIIAFDTVTFELQNCLGVDVESRDSRGHTAGEGRPGHAKREEREPKMQLRSYRIHFWSKMKL